jgi:SAM-dependent methyltransferase
MTNDIDFKCRICGNTENNEPYFVREKMFGSNEIFTYFKCSTCGCMQIENEHLDLCKYYEHYSSFEDIYQPNKVKDFLLKHYFKYKLGKFTISGFILYLLLKNHNQPWLLKQYFNFNAHILDIGSGAGRLLHLMHKRGFNYVTGLDPFNKETIVYDNNLIIDNCSLYEIKGQYDIIMMHHSLEHMPDPHKIMQRLQTLLKDNGTLLIRIPVIDSFAWRKYGVEWVQMDAPRHLYLYTVKSLMLLCNQYGFYLDKVVYDSTAYQFSNSEKYVHGISFVDKKEIVSAKEKRRFNKFAKQLNERRDGDQANFYFKKIINK